MSKAYLYERSIRKVRPATKEDHERHPGIFKIGDPISYIPPAKDKKELFERFEQFEAMRAFEANRSLFFDKYGKSTKKAVQDELNEIYAFINEAEKLSVKETFQNQRKASPHLEHLNEYSRLINGYYSNPKKRFQSYEYYHHWAKYVYGKYVLYKEWLETELIRLDELEIIANSSTQLAKLLEFVDFLDLKKYDFKLLLETEIKDLEELDKVKRELNPDKTFKDRQRLNQLKAEINNKFEVVKQNAVLPIKERLTALKIWQGDDGATSIYNLNRPAIEEIKRHFTDEQIPIIQKYKQKYVSYRNTVNTDFFALSFQFQNLDEIFKILFDYFDEIKTNDFDTFAEQTLMIDDISEVAGLLKQGNLNFSFQLPTDAKTWDEEDYLKHYLNTKRIGFQMLLTAYKSKEFDKVNNRLKNYFERYKYIFDNVNDVQRIELKNDALDSLKKGIEYQELTKFKELLQETYTKIKQYPLEQFLPLPFEELTTEQKGLRISLELLGENNGNNSSILYHHIPKVLKQYNLNTDEAKNILLTYRGAFSPIKNKTVIPAIVDYLKEVDFDNNESKKANETELSLESNQHGKFKIQVKPIIYDAVINSFYEILKGYFESEQQNELKTLLETGNEAQKKLIFKGQCNKLTDAFKQLYEANLLTGCLKQDLQMWLVRNFQYLNRKNIPTDLNSRTVEKSISGNEYPCKNPILTVEQEKVLRAD